MLKNDWSLLQDIISEHIQKLKDEREEIPEEDLAEFDECAEKVDEMFCHLKCHIEYIKEITHWLKFMDKDKAIQYLTAISTPGIDRPKAECGFKRRTEAS